MASEKKQKICIRSKVKRYGKHQAGIGSSSKGHAFSGFRKLKAVNEYKKHKRKQQGISASMQKDFVSQALPVQNAVDEFLESSPNVKSGERFNAKNKYQAALKAYENDKAEKKRLRKEEEEMRQRLREEMKQKEEKRRETKRKLKERTKRGQPIMANHIECLLEKIERG